MTKEELYKNFKRVPEERVDGCLGCFFYEIDGKKFPCNDHVGNCSVDGIGYIFKEKPKLGLKIKLNLNGSE